MTGVIRPTFKELEMSEGEIASVLNVGRMTPVIDEWRKQVGSAVFTLSEIEGNDKKKRERVKKLVQRGIVEEVGEAAPGHAKRYRFT